MLVTLLLNPQGLKLADVENPIQWRFRPELKVTVHAEVDNSAEAEAEPEEVIAPDPLEVAAQQTPVLAAKDFPVGTDLAALESAAGADAIPLLPGASFERKKK